MADLAQLNWAGRRAVTMLLLANLQSEIDDKLWASLASWRRAGWLVGPVERGNGLLREAARKPLPGWLGCKSGSPAVGSHCAVRPQWPPVLLADRTRALNGRPLQAGPASNYHGASSPWGGQLQVGRLAWF